MKKISSKNSVFTSFLIFLFFIVSPAFSQFMLEAEGSLILPGYNDIRIPGEGGSLINAGDELDAENTFTFRARAGYKINERHIFSLLAAPLKINYAGARDESFIFHEKTFASNTPFDLEYVFNSYRFTYRYNFIRSEKWTLGAGATAKIRDAYIQVKQGSLISKKENVGFVPIINLYIAHWFSDKIGVVLEGDGLTTPFGRAFDFQLALPVYLTDKVGIKINYRVLEGGADNDEVYNFTLVNYVSAGVFYDFY